MAKRVVGRDQFLVGMRGKALGGIIITYFEYGIVAAEPAWMAANGLERNICY